MKKMRIFTFFISILIIITTLTTISASAIYDIEFETSSNGIYMVNMDTDTVVYEKNADQQMFPASLTKIMTTIIALETISDLEGTVVTAPSYIFNEFSGIVVSHADIRQKEEVRMIDLLYAIMLSSACEASSIVGDYIGGGSIPKFVEMMNQKAKQIGATNTNFVNAHGLHDPAQVTTPRDIYLITKYAMSLPRFEEIATTTSYYMPPTNKHAEKRLVIHTNKMLSKVRGGSQYYPYVRGIKTGTTPQAGANLVSIASKNGYNYMLVTLGAPLTDESGNKYDKNFAYQDAINLYNWAFDGLKLKTVVTTEQTYGEVKVGLSSKQDFVTVLSGKELSLLLPANVDLTNLLYDKTFNENVKAPIKTGQKLGKMDIKLKNETIATVDLVASEDVGRNPILYAIDLVKRFFKSFWVKLIFVLFLAMVVLYICYTIWYNKKRKKMRKVPPRYRNYQNR